MDERSVIIADSDFAYRSTMASFFRKAGYRVEATDSTDQVLDSIQANEAPVLVLGSDFGKVASADLVHLLKKCNRRLQIILVTDGMTLSQTRQVCQEGIFYHALKPATAGEAEEIGQAVDCAFEKQAVSQPDPAPAAHQQPAQKSARAQLMNALPWAAGIVALILGTNYLSLPATGGAHNGSSLAVWLFLAFCALIVTGQLLPIFRTKPSSGRVGHRQMARESSPRGGK
jgi:DNA-binding NtrC family response regulator